MDGRRWARVKEIFAEVAHLAPDERPQALAEACGSDADLRREVESLLDAEAGAPTFLEGNAPAFAASSLGGIGDRELGAAAPDTLLGSLLGHVRIEKVLGDGGFGRVYLGRDTRLDRDLAVKVLRSSQRLRAEARERLRREARLLSKLDHPNICRIYGLLEEGETDYLLLEYIAGDRLTEAAATADVETRLELVRQIASALSAAHREGIIHRDLKPDNVLVTTGGVAKVLDLGVAKLALDAAEGGPSIPPREPPHRGGESRDDLTRRGSRLGTIRYMSPEQARGEALTTSSDVFALGLVAHELLGGAPAYRADAADELLSRVQHGATEPLEHEDADLVALVGRLLAADPAERPSAARVVEEIDALLARPRLRRRRLLRRVAVSAVAVAALAVLAGWWALRRQAARDLATAAQVLSEVKDIEWRMRAEHLSPQHDITPARDAVALEIEALAGRIDDLGPRARGRGRYALGRAALSIGDLARARSEVEAAWESGYREPEVAYTLGRVLAREFRDQVEWNDRRFGPEERAEKLAGLRERLGKPASEYLKRAKDARVGPPQYIESLLRVAAGDYSRALQELDGIETGWFYERDQLAGWIHLELARDESVEGSIAAVGEHLTRASDAYRRAIAAGRSAPQGYLGLCRTATYRLLRGQVPADQVEQTGREAVEACEGALELDPGAVEVRWELASAYEARAQAAFGRGEDAGELLAAAERFAAEGLELAPDSSDFQSILVRTLWRKSIHQRLRGDDPSATYERGREIARRIAAREAATAADLNSLVVLALDYAIHAMSRGESPVAILQEATAAGERAIAIEPDTISLSNLSGCYYLLGAYQADHGIDPRSTIRSGLAVVRQSLDAVPGQLLALRVLGNLHVTAHRHATRAALDVESPYAAAREAYREALEVEPAFVWARLEWINLDLQHARWQIEEGESPVEALETARRELEAVGESEDVRLFRFYHQGRAELLTGRWRSRRGLSPEDSLRRAQRAFSGGIATTRQEAGLFIGLGETFLEQARWVAGNDAREALRLASEGFAAVGEAVAIEATSADAHDLRAALLRFEAGLRTGPEARAALERAAEAQSRACEINRFLPSCSAARDRSLHSAGADDGWIGDEGARSSAARVST